MATNLDLDPALVDEAVAIGGRIFTADEDFTRFAKILPIVLYAR